MKPEQWKIYCDSFPIEERRRQRSQMAIEKNPAYQVKALLHDKETVGIICYWNFPEFCFIEHFALAEAYRGKGLGKTFLYDFIKGWKKPLVLEVELPGTEALVDGDRHRRIEFYKNVGFALTHFSYLQPPYEKGHVPIPLTWMTYGLEKLPQSGEHQIDDHSGVFAQWKNTLFTAVYRVNQA